MHRAHAGAAAREPAADLQEARAVDARCTRRRRVASSSSHLSASIAVEVSAFLIANVPPKPQHSVARGEGHQLEPAHVAEQRQRRLADVGHPERVTGRVVGDPVRETTRRRRSRRAGRRAAPRARTRAARASRLPARAARRRPRGPVRDRALARSRRTTTTARRSTSYSPKISTNRRARPSASSPVAAVDVHLAATRLLGGKHDLVPEPLEHAHGRAPGLGEHRVADAGDEQRDAHFYWDSYALCTDAMPRSAARRAACPPRGMPPRGRPRDRARRAARASTGLTSVSNASSRSRWAPRTSPRRLRGGDRILVDEECLRVGRLDVHHRLDHRVDLAFDVVRLVDHELDRCRGRGVAGSVSASAISRMIRNSSNGSIAPTIRSSSAYLRLLKWKPPSSPSARRTRDDLLDVRALRMVARVDEHLCLRPEPAADECRGAPVGQVGAVETRLEELVLDEEAHPVGRAPHRPRRDLPRAARNGLGASCPG